jgi:hypothetical protein
MATRSVFEDIPAHEWDTLRQKIARAGGRVIVMVHPYFYKNGGPTADSKTTNKSMGEFDGHVDKLLRQQKIPVVVLEGHTHIEQTQNRFKIMRVHPLIIPTEPESWRIRHSGKNSSAVTHDESQKQLINRLHNAGAKNVMIAGAEALPNEDRDVEAYEKRVHPKGIPREIPLTGSCAGNTYANLVKSEHFQNKDIRYHPGALFPYSPYNKPQRRRG